MGGNRKQSQDPPTSLSLEARPENAAVARRAVAEEAIRAGLDDWTATAAKVVVTEGFTNATRHAYAEPEGERIVVDAEADPEGITITVRDSGTGFQPRVPEADEAHRGGGFGLGLIAALAERVELRHLAGGGSEIRAHLGLKPGERTH